MRLLDYEQWMIWTLIVCRVSVEEEEEVTKYKKLIHAYQIGIFPPTQIAYK